MIEVRKEEAQPGDIVKVVEDEYDKSWTSARYYDHYVKRIRYYIIDHIFKDGNFHCYSHRNPGKFVGIDIKVLAVYRRETA